MTATQEKSVWERLREPFKDADLEWRVMQCGKKNEKPWAKLAAYVDSRAIMNRLDEVVGPENWQDSYINIDSPDGVGIICCLQIRADGETCFISKQDGASFNRGIEVIKSGISDSFKRAANKFGMGRHLYTIGETWANDIQAGYPPIGVKAVSIYSREKLGSDKYWCLAPILNGTAKTGEDPRQATQPQHPKTIKKQDLVNMVIRLEDRAFDSETDRDDARYGALAGKLPGDATMKQLEPYRESLLRQTAMKMEEDKYGVLKAWTAARLKHLGDVDLHKASADSLIAYCKHMKEKGDNS